ncbi:hypothetical protein ACWF2L_21395 [Streptomyces anulatus]
MDLSFNGWTDAFKENGPPLRAVGTRTQGRRSGGPSAKGVGDALAESVVPDGVDVAPGGVGDLFGLKRADLGVGAEEEPEVDMPVLGLALGTRNTILVKRAGWP